MSKLNLSFSMPNLPGMVPNTQSWLYRREERGFKIQRPDSATPGRPGTASLDRATSVNEIGLQSARNRPYTAQGGRLAQSIDNLKQFKTLQQTQNSTVQFQQRPRTAGPGGPSGSRSALNFENDQDLEFTGGLSKPAPAQSQAFTPLFVEKDRQVCRFYAHFFQPRVWEKDGPLGDPAIETNQCRRLTIFYYLIDDTIEISEPRAPNTGMPAGTFFRRGKVNNSRTHQPITLRDLASGNTVFILGQEIFLTDADAFTRDYFRRELNMILPPSLNRPEEMRKDLGAQFATGLGAHLPAVKTHFGTRSTDYLATKEVLDKTHQFLKHDGQVLRFQCVEVKGLDPPYFPNLVGETTEEDNFFGTGGGAPVVASANVKRFALCYYLTTNSIELVVQKKQGEKKGNSQGEPNLILKKSKLPRNWRDANRGRPPVYYETLDFQCGKVIDVFGRYFLLVNCDKATRQIYAALGVSQQDVPLIFTPEEKVEQPIPQLGDGFLPIGSNEDTLATVYGMPKAGKDVQKIQRNQNRLIRCKGVLLSQNAVDSSREFMITFFLEDDTIQVYEEVKRNSGIWGGNFLKRGRYTNDLPNDSETPRFFVPGDMYLGNVISFHGNEFQIVEMDNMSLKFCENYPDEFPMMDTFKIIGSMVLKVMDMQLDIRPIFKGADPQRHGWIDQDAFIRTLDGLGLIEDLNDQELLTLMRRFKDGDQYLYPEMCDLFSHVYQQHSSMNGSQAVNQSSYRKASMDFTSLKTFFDTARGKQNQWRRTLRKDPHTLHGYVTLAVLVKILNKFGLVMSEAVQKEIYLKYRAHKDLHGPILKELEAKHAAEDLYVGLDQKVVPKLLLAKASLKKELLSSASNATLRRQSMHHPSTPSVLRKGSSYASHDDDSQHVIDGSRPFVPSQLVIDYNKMCDEIYICDWI